MPHVHTAPDGECTYYEENDLPGGGETTVFCDRDAGHELEGQRHAYSMSSGEIEFGPALGDLLAEHGTDAPRAHITDDEADRLEAENIAEILAEHPEVGGVYGRPYTPEERAARHAEIFGNDDALTPAVLDEIAADLDAVAGHVNPTSTLPPGVMPPLPPGMVMTPQGPAVIVIGCDVTAMPMHTPVGVQPGLLWSFAGQRGEVQIALVLDATTLRQFVRVIREQAGVSIAEADKLRGPTLAVPPSGLIIPDRG